MAVHVRLTRHGTHKKPFYHIVAADHHKPRDGRFLEKVGYYDPKTNPSTIVVDEDRLRHWYERGAQLSPTVAKLIKVKKIALQRLKTGGKKS